jgi:erythromycin esterase-like protein
MGEWLARSRRSEMYSIGLFMGQGVVAANSGTLRRISISERDQLSAILANAGRKMSFVDFSGAKQLPGSDWIFKPIVDRTWLLEELPTVPIKMFDAAVYIHHVTPQEYIDWRW